MATIDRINDILREAFESVGGEHGARAYRLGRAGRIRCADGHSISVQGHWGAYSDPRGTGGPWLSVECGFPMDAGGRYVSPGAALERYADSDNANGDTVYGYVPIETVAAWIDSHGGIAP